MKHYIVTVVIAISSLFTSVQAIDSPPQEEKKGTIKSRPTFTISKETTFVLGPVSNTGYVDYLQALNEIWRRDVTVQNNAMVPLLQAMGPKPEGYKLPQEYVKRLGIDALPEQGDYLILWDHFFSVKQGDRAAWEKEFAIQWRVSMRPWSIAEFPRVAEWIKANSRAAELAIKASERTHFYSPYFISKPPYFAVDEGAKTMSHSLFSLLLPTVQRVRDFGTLLTARAMLHTGEGRHEEALKDLIACHRLARLVAKSGNLIERLVGLSVDAIAMEAGYSLIADARVTQKALLQYQAEIKALQPFRSIAEVVDQGERLQCLDIMFHVVRDGVLPLERLASFGTADEPGVQARIVNALLFQNLPWDQALKETNAWFDRIVTAMKVEDSQLRWQGIKALDTEMKQQRKSYEDLHSKIQEVGFTPADRARFLADIARHLLTPAVLNVSKAYDKQEQQLRHLHLTLALALYRQKHGQYPDKLADLVSNELKVIPSDLYSNKEPIYRRLENGFVLYSIGPNGQDDQGRTRDDDEACDDITVRVPRPDLKTDKK